MTSNYVRFRGARGNYRRYSVRTQSRIGHNILRQLPVELQRPIRRNIAGTIASTIRIAQRRQAGIRRGRLRMMANRLADRTRNTIRQRRARAVRRARNFYG